MSTDEENPTPAELDRVKRLLAETLTISTEEAAKLARAHRPEVLKLAISFEKINLQIGQNWAETILAKVPLSAWDETYNNELHVRPSRSASMRFLSHGTPTKNALQVRDFRRSAHQILLESMPVTSRLDYRPMLEWEEVDGRQAPSLDYTLSADTAFGQSLRAVEEMFNAQLRTYEQDFRQDINFPASVATPVKVSMHYSKCAYKHIAALIEQMCVLEGDLSSSIKENLAARVSANLSCNRMLLEHAAKEARGVQALEMCIPFFERLNYHGLTMVPGDFLDVKDDGATYLRKLFTDWFSIDGVLVRVDPYFKRHMTDSDIELIINWSKYLQDTYVATEGLFTSFVSTGCRKKAAEQSKAAHGTPLNRFIFGAVLAAAYYETTQTAREFTGHSKSKYSVFPARGDAVRNDAKPAKHAQELLLQAYGQVMFSNIGWELKADKLTRYAQKRSVVRAHLQQLLYFAVKNRTSRQLYSLFQELHRLKASPEEPTCALAS